MTTDLRAADEQGCKSGNRICAACRMAVGMKTRPVFVTDSDEDPDVQIWRTLGEEWIERIRLRSV